jgi:hypothetical protein
MVWKSMIKHAETYKVFIQNIFEWDLIHKMENLKAWNKMSKTILQVCIEN